MAQAFYDSGRAELDASIFSAAPVGRSEGLSLFRRNWLFLGPARWLDRPGAYALASMGEMPVLLWRGDDGAPRVFVNQCVSGTGQIATDERGVATALHCTCHGWTYRMQEDETAVTPDVVPQVRVYRGLVFACRDADAPPFEQWLGDFRLYFDALLDSLPGGAEICGGAAFVSHMRANWKLPVEAYCGDLRRDTAAVRGGYEADGSAIASAPEGFQVVTDAGAIVMEGEGPDIAAFRDGPFAGMRPVSATLFPNLCYDARSHTLHLWSPRGAEALECRSFCLAGRSDTDEARQNALRRCALLAGPMGLDMQGNETIWSATTRASRGRIARRHPLNIGKGLGEEWRANLPGRMARLGSESNQRGFYEWWQGQMQHEQPAERRAMRLKRHASAVAAPARNDQG